MSLNKTDLDQLVLSGCRMPDCDHKGHAGEPMILAPRCCLGSGRGVNVSYRYDSGVLVVRCGHCGKVVSQILVQQE